MKGSKVYNKYKDCIMNSIIISPAQISHITDLFLALGGEKNILSVTNCMSRVRIAIHSDELLDDEEIFLSLNAKGIIREKGQIHLVYGQYSGILKEHLSFLLDTLKDKTVLKLLFLSQGISCIKSIKASDSEVHVLFSKNISMDRPLFEELNKIYKLSYDEVKLLLKIRSSDVELATKLNYGVFFWDLILASDFLNSIDAHYIEDFSSHNYKLTIHLNKMLPISDNPWKHLGIKTVHQSIEEQEMRLSPITDGFLPILNKYYSLLEKQKSFFDKK